MSDSRFGVLSLSGGLDSSSLLLRLLKEDVKVFGLSFRYGQKHEVELQRLKSLLDFLNSKGFNVQHNTVDLSTLGPCLHSALTDHSWEMPKGFYAGENMKQTVVPNRNAIFASISYAFALSVSKQYESPVRFGLGVHSGDHAIYPDCRPEFYDALLSAFEIGNWDTDDVSLFLPYLNFDKSQIISDAVESCEKLDLDYREVLGKTWTSYNPPSKDGLADGSTGSDVERILAFDALGLEDPVGYEGGWETAVENAKRLKVQFEQTQQ